MQRNSPNLYLLDPISFHMFMSSVDVCRISYWAFTYGGYSGDLSPKSTLDLLSKEENVVLIDVRPEARDCKFHQPFLF